MYYLLIVDDDADERDLIRFLLKDYDHKFCFLEAQNGSEAFEMLENTHVDIIISDIQMPFMDGIELATKTRRQFPDIEILFISGHDEFSYAQSALSLKVSDYILKPIDQQKFHNSMKNILKRLNSNVLEFTKTEGYIEKVFYDVLDNEVSAEDYETADTTEDHILLRNVELAVRNMHSEQLKEAVMCFVRKYQLKRDMSHIYMRYVATAMIQAMNPSWQPFTTEELERAMRAIYSYRHFSDICNLLEEYLNKAIAAIEKENDSKNFAVIQVKRYIRENYEKDMSLDMLADLVYLSPNYLSNVFVKNTGISINKYIRKVRLEKAKELLINSNMKIADISSKVGYTSTSYFCKLFQEEFGDSPEKFRTSG